MDGNGKMAIIVTLVAALVQAIVYGVWIGGLAKQVEVNARWIERRNEAGGEARMAVVEQKLQQIDDHLKATDQGLVTLDARQRQADELYRLRIRDSDRR